MPQDPQKCDFGVILGAPGDPIWRPVATNFGLWTRSGGFLGARWRHFGPIWLPLGFDVICGPEHGENMIFFGVADVAEV